MVFKDFKVLDYCVTSTLKSNVHETFTIVVCGVLFTG